MSPVEFTFRSIIILVRPEGPDPEEHAENTAAENSALFASAP